MFNDELEKARWFIWYKFFSWPAYSRTVIEELFSDCEHIDL